MADDLTAPSWTAEPEKIDSLVEETNFPVRQQKTFAGQRIDALYGSCEHCESSDSDKSELRDDSCPIGGNSVNELQPSGVAGILDSSPSGASYKLRGKSNHGAASRYKMFEFEKQEARHQDDHENNTEELNHFIRAQNFMRSFQDSDDHTVTSSSTKSSPDTDVDHSSFQVSSSTSTSTATVAEDLNMNAGPILPLDRAQSAKERPTGLTERRFVLRPDDDFIDNYLSDHYKSRTNSTSETLARTRSAGTVTDLTFKQAERAAVIGLIALEHLKAKAEILERTLSSFVGSDIRNIQPTPLLYTNGSFTKEILSRCGSAEAEDQDPKSALEPHELQSSPIEQVELIVPKTDDPSIPVWTFRTVVLGVFSCVLISFLNTYFSYRNEPIVTTITTLLIATAPLGKFMASVLPDKFVRWPGTQKGFSLNPGPFNMKEHALITIFASGGSVRPGGIFVVNIIKIYLNRHIGLLPGFLVTFTVELLGYGWAVLLQKLFVEPPQMWWPGSLVNVSLIRALYLSPNKRRGILPLQFFLICFIAASAYYVVPGLFIPSLGTLSVVCLIFKDSVLAQQLGSGKTGLGLGAVSLDWATITAFLGSPLVVPWAAVVNISIGFVIQAYFVGPLTYWKNWYHSKNYPLWSTNVFTPAGRKYDISRITGVNRHPLHRNRSGFAQEGLPHFSAFYTMSMGFTFALFASVISQTIFFYGKDLLRLFRDATTGKLAEEADIHTKLMRVYPPIPMQWVAILFLGAHLLAIGNLLVYKDQLDMQWWGIFLSTGVVGVLVVPINVLVATTNQVPNLGLIPQYLMGFLRTGEPITNVMFRTYSTVVCTRSATYLGNFKLGHYMKIPPRATFYAQLISTVVASLVSTIVAKWLQESINNICDTTRLPRNSTWTCPQDRVFFDQAISFGLVGPHRLFTKRGAPYRTLNFYFIPGFLFPLVVWMLTVAFPRRAWIRLINAPLIIRGAALMPPSPIVNNVMWIYLALFFSIYVFGCQKSWWKRYNYVLSAALDAGTVVMAILQYYALDSGKRQINWWGRRANGDHCPLASCPTAQGIVVPGCPVH